jgi:hypothetical protein
VLFSTFGERIRTARTWKEEFRLQKQLASPTSFILNGEYYIVIKLDTMSGRKTLVGAKVEKKKKEKTKEIKSF